MTKAPELPAPARSIADPAEVRAFLAANPQIEFFELIFTAMSGLAQERGAINLGQGFPDEPGPEAIRRRAADEAIECIGCGICYSACDVVAWDPDYLGPAALNRAWTLVNDARDTAGAQRLEAIGGDGGCQCCHTHMSCTSFCPKGIAPTYSIAGLKRAVLWQALKGGRK